MMNAIAVAILASDPVTREGAAIRLSSYPDITVLAPDQQQRASALLIITAQVTDGVLQLMERAYGGSPDRRLRVVLVADHVTAQDILRGARSGLVSMLYRHEAGYDPIVRAIRDADASRAELPAVILRRLLGQVRASQHDAPGAERPATRLAIREVEVLRLLSEGLDTTEVATKLNYSERTVKTIVHDIVSRLNLRNRTHAVAYAVRSGAL